MTLEPSDINALVASAVVLLGALGAGVKWLLVYISAKQAQSALTESEARSALSTRLHEEIRVLRIEVAALHTENRIYLRRIFQLEGVINDHPDITLPATEGWPPP